MSYKETDKESYEKRTPYASATLTFDNFDNRSISEAVSDSPNATTDVGCKVLFYKEGKECEFDRDEISHVYAVEAQYMFMVALKTQEVIDNGDPGDFQNLIESLGGGDKGNGTLH